MDDSSCLLMCLWEFNAFPGGSVAKEPTCNAGDAGRSPGEGTGNPLQYCCLGDPLDRGAWQAVVHGIARVGQDLVT